MEVGFYSAETDHRFFEPAFVSVERAEARRLSTPPGEEEVTNRETLFDRGAASQTGELSVHAMRRVSRRAR